MPHGDEQDQTFSDDQVRRAYGITGGSHDARRRSWGSEPMRRIALWCLAIAALAGVIAGCAQLIGIEPLPDLVCGDGIVSSEAGEECDDGNTASGDGCSADCRSETCGNGSRDPGEACDDGGNSAACDADCTVAVCGDGFVNPAAGEGCEDGNAVSGDGCDPQCRLECGNGVREPAEECDKGGNTPNCDADCTAPECGDGFLNPAFGEVCDENGISTSTCNGDCMAPMCGDGFHNSAAGEQCDDGNVEEGDGCDSQCRFESCGNGIQTSPEACDDGGDSDTCNANCTVARCGDGFTNPSAGEQCDGTGGCDSYDCTLTRCGDGVLGSVEACDSGGVNTSFCDFDCTSAVCGDGVFNPNLVIDPSSTPPLMEQCDDGKTNNGSDDYCDDSCQIAFQAPPNGCGDGIIDRSVGEECDDGNRKDFDLCNNLCRLTSCGDATVNSYEQCDDGNNTSGDGCSADCQVECRNGRLDAFEQCDDGDRVNGDGCSADCRFESCGDRVIDAVEVCDEGGNTSTCDADCTAAECGDGFANRTTGELCDDGNLDSGDGCSASCQPEP